MTSYELLDQLDEGQESAWEAFGVHANMSQMLYINPASSTSKKNPLNGYPNASSILAR